MKARILREKNKEIKLIKEIIKALESAIEICSRCCEECFSKEDFTESWCDYCDVLDKREYFEKLLEELRSIFESGTVFHQK